MVMMTMKAKLKWVILIALTAVSAAIVAVVIFHGVRGEEWAVVSGVNYRLNAKNEEEERMKRTIKTVKWIIELAGFDLCSRIELRDKKSGKIYL